MKFSIFASEKNLYILHGQVFVMYGVWKYFYSNIHFLLEKKKKKKTYMYLLETGYNQIADHFDTSRRATTMRQVSRKSRLVFFQNSDFLMELLYIQSSIKTGYQVFSNIVYKINYQACNTNANRIKTGSNLKMAELEGFFFM